ncbi:lipoyl(octanoyl) transferase LipB [Kushneria marisflavi]|uniref:Octanoyltransferase n=1 Tax=Kushneria marisflavi TaxID=157779 RepID=A0A240UL51_9GAMM|nr:lipoyl(octanoyl) transferase LipB [Kushneria marisflavi]ART61856.1 octanoyltransferase [Kushneria marisflavi]RKD86897.1 lipoyl(octanoyl) transferase [Kushneria marisflavi]
MSDTSLDDQPIGVYRLGTCDYTTIWEAMRRFTDERTATTQDQIWLVEHFPVFTQGRAGKPEHLLRSSDIPLVQSDRGGQVTYHGPGQLVMYPLIDVKRRRIGVRAMVDALENAVIRVLSEHGINACSRSDAPGVYVDGAKIASLGLRIRRGSSFHGIAFNIDMDLSPFDHINPCGYAGLRMTQLRDLLSQPPDMAHEAQGLLGAFAAELGNPELQNMVNAPGVLTHISRVTGSN